MASLNVNDGGVWKQATPWVNDAGTWKKPQKVWVNDAGTWKQVWSSVTYSPVAGSYSRDTVAGPNSFTITASAPVVWNWTKTGIGSSSVANGGTASSITFNVSQNNSTTFNVSSGGNSWTIDFMGAV